MLDDAYLASRAKLIDTKRAQDFGAGNPVKGGTIYLTAADESGMMVSFIQSNYMGFGSGVRRCPTSASACRTAATASAWMPAARTRWRRASGRSTPSFPAFLTKDGQPVMSFGVMGGDMQPQGHMQTLVRMLDYRQNPQAACDAPRWRFNAGAGDQRRAADAPRPRCAALQELRPRDGRHQRQLPGLRRRPVHLARSATRRSKATSPPATRAATAWPPAADAAARLPRRAAPRPGCSAMGGAIAFSGKAIIVKLAYRYGVDAVTLIMLRMLFALPLFVAWRGGPGAASRR